MGFAEDKFLEYLRRNLPLLKNIKVDELLIYMSGHLSEATLERLDAYVKNKGNRSVVLDFYLDLSRCDDWVSTFIYALGQCGHKDLERTFGEVYSGYQLPSHRQSSPQSLPPSLNHNNPQPQSPQRISSLPGQRPPVSPGTQPDPSPKPSQSPGKVQREQMTRSSPPQQNHEHRSLPAFGTHNPSVAPRPEPSQNVSAPVHSDMKTLDDTFRNPVPETTPYLAVPSQGDEEPLQEDASSISKNPYFESDPLPSNSVTPRLNVLWPEASNKPTPEEDLSQAKVSIKPSSEELSPVKVSIRPSSEDLSPAKASIRPSSEELSPAKVSIRPSSEELSPAKASIRPSSEELSPAKASIRPSSEELSPANVSISTSSEDLFPNAPIRPSSEDGPLVKVTETRNTLSIRDGGADNQRGQTVRNKTQKLPEQVAAYIPISSGQDRGGNEQQRQQPVIHKAVNSPLQSVSAASTHMVREKVVVGALHNGQSTCQAVEDVPESRPEYYRPVNRGSAEEGLSRQWSASQRVSSGSSCRPMDDNDEEEYLSKPGVLEYTLGCDGATNADAPMTSFPNLQISDCSDRSGSSNAGSQSSSSRTQDGVPPFSTPKNRSLPLEAKRSPEENEYTFDMMSSPGRNKRLDHLVSQQPEENSFRSREVGQYGFQYNEEPEEDLMERNENALRSRTKTIPNTSEPNDQTTKQKSSKKTEGRDRERMVLITITVTSLCLSLYLLWKNHQK
ncbi:uncharacterized protein RB166_021037 [Leptodactylus fuscus]|uniref:uncharacterized protein LOC142187989 n=1 Tax=Leptodactylus fuscus TaxID=238119 RepID=UPI003F4F1BAA